MVRRFRFGLIGCGCISRNHLEAIKAIPEAALIGVCDVEAGKLSETAAKYFCKGYSDYKAMLAEPEFDIINICTPSGMHAKMAIDAMNAGKHVLVEKPMAMSLYEADAMLKAAAQNGVKLGVVHQNRFNKAIVKLRKAVEVGKFGQLTHGSAIVRWNRGDEYYKQAPWRGTLANDGGCLMNQAIHNIDLLQWMLGEVTSIFAYTATNLRAIEGEDTAVAVLEFKNGALATIEAATTIYPQNLEGSISIFGSTGTAVVGGVAANKIKAWRFPEEDEGAVLQEQVMETANVYGFGHIDIIQDFVDAVKDNKAMAVSGYEARKALEIILAIYHSARLHNKITLPLQEEFRLGQGLSLGDE